MAPTETQGMTMSRSKSGIDPEIIRELANLLTETDLTEIEVQQADLQRGRVHAPHEP